MNLFVGEIGINHQGDIDVAKKLIEISKEAGVDVVKFQKRNPDICVPESQKNIIKDTIFGVMPYIEYKHKIEFGKDEYDEIDRYCKELGILWTASVWDIDSLDFILNYDIPFIKIPSAMITNNDLMSEIKKKNVSVILSTGMSTEQEIINAISLLSPSQIKGILHCNSSYPALNEELDLKYIKTLEQMYQDFEIGYSGHEQGILPTLVARSLGAKIIERHITLDKEMKGSDHKSSLSPLELKELLLKLQTVDKVLGNNKKHVYPQEILMKQKLRNS